MNASERLSLFFSRGKVDRLPCIEWAMWWDLTLSAWKNQGVDTSVDPKVFKNGFGLDYDRQFWVSNDLNDTCPKYKEHGFISNEAEYDVLRPHLYKTDFLPDMRKQLSIDDDITWFTLPGFFWFPRQLFGIEDHLYSFYDYPELYHRICSDMTEYYNFVIEEITKSVSPQFMTFAEDMSYNLGPMLSKETYDEFIAPYYRRIIPLLKSKNIKVIVDSDGDITKMIPWMIESGVDGILPLERQAGVDIDTLSQQYPDFFFIGGFDKMVMKHGEQAIRDEFERIYSAMRRGNYIPSVDHQTPPDVPIENYRFYVKLLRQYCERAVAE